MNKLLYLTK